MKTQKIAPIVFPSGKQRALRYALAALNTVVLMSTIVFVTWILGKIIAVLHALVFSMALADTPEIPPKSFPMLEHFNTTEEAYTIFQYSKESKESKESEQAFDSETLYTVDHNDWSK